MMVSNRVVEHVRLQNEAKSADLDAAGEDESKDAPLGCSFQEL